MSYLTAEQEKMFNDNYRLVYYTYKRYDLNCSPNDVDDVVSEGFIGLMRACREYNAETGNDFSTFAVHCIYNAMSCAKRSIYLAKRLETISLDDVCVDRSDNFDMSNINNGSIASIIGKQPDEDDITPKIELNRVLDRINCLYEKHKMVALKTMQGYKGSVIAREMNVSREAVRAMLVKIRAYLRAPVSELKRSQRKNSIYFKVPKY